MKVVAISGPSCSGKSTIAQNLVRLIPGSIIVHQDDFYMPDSELPQTNGVANWDCPEAFDMNRFATVLKELNKGIKPQYKTYEKEMVEKINVSVPDLEPIAIVEGIMLYQKGSAALPLFDTKILVVEDKNVLKERRSKRTYDTVEGEWSDPPGYFDDIVWPEFENNYGYLLENGHASEDARKQGITVVPPGSLESMFNVVIDTIKQGQNSK